uniref:Uncharacterized protein n=1 Tax=Romanomermis culicivorax TaxID=13658 RepID=A0A915HQ48_ROMCU
MNFDDYYEDTPAIIMRTRRRENGELVLEGRQDREKESEKERQKKMTKDKPIAVNQVVATEEKCPEIAFVGNAPNGSTKKYNQTKARPQNQLQKAVEEQRSDGNGEKMQPGLSTRDVKQTNEEQAKESFLAILSKEWLQLVQKVDKLQVTQNEALKELTTVVIG